MADENKERVGAGGAAARQLACAVDARVTPDYKKAPVDSFASFRPRPPSLCPLQSHPLSFPFYALLCDVCLHVPHALMPGDMAHNAFVRLTCDVEERPAWSTLDRSCTPYTPP